MRAALLALATAVVIAAPAAAQEADTPPGITTSAEAAVSAPQDIASFTFGVSALRTRPAAAQSVASRRMARIVRAVRAQGVAAEDIVTLAISITRERRRLRPKGRFVTRYRARHAINVTVREISRTGAVVDAAARAGATNIFGPEFDVSNREELYQQALRLALRRARAKAQVLAEEAGLTLGRPTRIVEGSIEQFSADEQGASGGGSAPAPTSVRAGRERVGATVIATFAVS